jgi:type 1 fimbria pilin
MKRVLFLCLALCVVTTVAFAQQAAPPAKPATTDTVTLTGDIIDNMCATTHKDNLAEYVRGHTKECALMPPCVASGYSIFADGKLSKFDKDSDAKIEGFLKKADSKVHVVVVAKKVGQELSLVSIENQK